MQPPGAVLETRRRPDHVSQLMVKAVESGSDATVRVFINKGAYVDIKEMMG